MPFPRRTFQGLSVLVLVFSLAWILGTKSQPGQAGINQTAAPQKGFLAPDFEAETPTGEAISLSGFRGSPVILNLWASWCPPCREEMPALERVYADYKEDGLVIIGLHMTAQDSRQAAIDFIDQNQLSFQFLLDTTGEVSRKYRAQALPTTFFIGSDGVIRDMIVGGPITESVFRAQAENLIKGNP